MRKLPLWLVRLISLSLFCLASQSATAQETLRIGLSADVTSMDPQWNNSGPNVAISTHVFDPLTLTDRNGRLIPGLATSWRSVDPLTWEFKLRQGVKFHDGSDFTADDVIFSLDRPNKLTGATAPFTQFVRAIVSKQALDRYTVRIKTAQPYVLLPYDMNSIFIVSKKLVGDASGADFDSGKVMIGTGPYKFVSFKRGDRVDLVRNDNYWGTKPVWENVSFRLLISAPTRIVALMTGEVDAIENIPTQDITRLRENKAFHIEQQTSWRTIFWHMDQWRDASPDITDRSGKPLTKNPLKDARVRLAISKAINRPALTARVMEGLAVPASNLVAPGVFGYNDAIKIEAYDIEGAKKLMADAGYPNGFNLVLHAPNNRYLNDSEVAQTTAAMLGKIGIVAKVETLPWANYIPKARSGEFSMMLTGWGSVLGDNTVRTHLATPNDAKNWGGWNFGRSSNPDVDALIEKDFETFDDRQREDIAKTLMATALKPTPVIPLYHQLASWAMRKGVSYAGRLDEFTLAQQFGK